MGHVPGLNGPRAYEPGRFPTPNVFTIQHARVDLVRELDKEKIRYPDDDLGKVDPPKSRLSGELEPM